MDENLHNIENLFKKGLEDAEDLPAGTVWNNIEHILNKNSVAEIKKINAYQKRVILLLIFLLVSLGLYEIKIGHSHQSNNQTSNNTLISLPEIISKQKNQTDTIQDVQNSSSSTNSQLNITGYNETIPTTKSLLKSAKTPVNKKANSNLELLNQATTKSNTLTASNQQSSPINRNKKIQKTDIRAFSNIQENINSQNFQNNISLPAIITISSNKIVVQGDLLNTENLANQHILTIKPKLQPEKGSQPIPVLASNKINQSHSFHLIPFYSPEIAWYRLEEDKPDNQPDNQSSLEQSEKHEFSYSLGILTEYNINKHWSVQSGITYSNTNISVDPKNIYAQNDNAGSIKFRINTSSGYGYLLPSFSKNPAIGDSVYSYATSHSLQYLGIPLLLNYNILKSKFTFSASAGVSMNFLLKGRIETMLEKGSDSESEILNKLDGLKIFYFSGMTSLGVEYKLNNKLSLLLKPTFRFALNAINQDNTVKSYPKSVDLILGLKIML